MNRIKNDKQKTDLTYEDYVEFTNIKNCTYCNSLIPWVEYGDNTPGFFLDRKINSLCHMKSNLVVCCGICNFTKRDFFYL